MRSRLLLGLVATVALLIAAVAYFVAPNDATSPPSTLVPQPDYAFAWVGRSDNSQFSDDDIRQLAAGYSIVVIAKFHADFDVRAQEEAARRIKAVNPRTKVLMYYSASYWFDRSQYGVTFDGERFGLRDSSGEAMRFRLSRREGGIADWVDLSNPGYRAFALDVIKDWMDRGGFDGVAFDAAHHIGADLPVAGDRSTTWSELLSPQKIAAYNAGLDQLLQEAKQELDPDGLVLYNGVPQGSELLPDRNLDLLQFTDGATNERFCVGADGKVNDLRADIELLQTAAAQQKKVLQKVNGADSMSDSERMRLGRFCYGSFLLGAEPGNSYFKMGTDYSETEFDTNPTETTLPIGDPVGPPMWDRDIGRRNFTNGEVFSNVGTKAAIVTVDRPLQMISSDGKTTALGSGEQLTLAGQDSLILIEPP